MVVVPAVRSGIQDGSMTPESAVKQLGSAAKQIPIDPTSTVAEDLDLAAVDLSQFNLRAVNGEPAGKWAKRFAAELSKIINECQQP